MTPEQVLDRFDRKIKWVTKVAVFTYEPYLEHDDVMQEAQMLVLRYAGLLHDAEDHYRLLDRIEEEAGGDESRVQALLSADLRLDLMRKLSRQLDAQLKLKTVSLDALPAKYQGSYEIDDEVADRVDRQREVKDMYPFLALRYFKRMSIQEISDSKGISIATVKRHIAEEKSRAYRDPAIRTRAGLGLAA